MKKQIKTLLAAAIVSTPMVGFAAPAFAQNYVVQDNDTLWTISQAHNVPLNDVLAANKGVNPLTLQAGQTINLPNQSSPTAPRTYKASDTDTFWGISKKFNVPLATVLAANPNIEPTRLAGGMIVKLTLDSGQASMPRVQSKSEDQADSVVSDIAKASDSAQGSVDAPASNSQTSKTYSMTATAYSGDAGSSLDATGNTLKLGTIAVDPSVIPLGSKVLITGYDCPLLPKGGLVATASDTGGAIKGNRIDIYVPGTSSQVDNFGMQNVTVKVLK